MRISANDKVTISVDVAGEIILHPVYNRCNLCIHMYQLTAYLNEWVIKQLVFDNFTF